MDYLLKIYLERLRVGNLYPVLSDSSVLTELIPNSNSHGFSSFWLKTEPEKNINNAKESEWIFMLVLKYEKILLIRKIEL